MQHLGNGKRRCKPHHTGSDARRGSGHDAGSRLQMMSFHAGLGGQQHGAGPIVQRGSVARSHGAVGPDHRLQPGQGIQRGFGPGLLVACHGELIALLLRNHHGNDLPGEEAAPVGFGPARLPA